MSGFDFKEEMKKMKESAGMMNDPKLKKAFIEQKTAELKHYAEMLKKTSQFVNSKNKNGKK
jgi:hypothetical protein